MRSASPNFTSGNMLAALGLFVRGFTIVMLTAMNVYQIANTHYLGAFLNGTAISVVWWWNARHSARTDVPAAALWYGLGAGAGTVCGMAVMQAWYG